MNLKPLFFIIGLLVVWLLIQVFSHDYVAGKINQSNQLKRHQIQSGTHQYVVDHLTMKSVVGVFKNDWVASEDGIVSVKPEPQISIELHGFLIVPRLHQTLVINSKVDSISSEASFRIELSNQKEQIYYHSDAIKVAYLAQTLDLSQIQWQVISKQNKTPKPNDKAWNDLESFDALVIRFYDTELVYLKQISIPQHEPQIIDDESYITCEFIYLKCLNNNYKNHVESKWNYAKGASFNHYESLGSMSTLWWLAIAALILCLLLLCIQAFSIKMLGLVLLICVSIGVLHQPFMLVYVDLIKWLLLIPVLLLLWTNKKALIQPQGMAIGVYIISLVLAVLMLVVGQKTPDFAAELPGYFIWALLQQLLLGPVVSDFIKVNSKANNAVTAIFVGVLFSIIHAPNHTLMLATLLGGAAWSYSWLRYNNIYANAISHALLALVFYAVMPDAWLGSARIGVFF